MTTIVRFAPSPTGLLQVGNARTAMLNATLAASVLISVGGAAAQPSIKAWRPGDQLIAHIDSLATRFKLPKGFPAVSVYNRYYWGIDEGESHRLVEGFFVSPQAEQAPCNDRGLYCSRPSTGSNRRLPGDIHIVPASEVPVAMGGRCEFVHLEFEVETKKLDIFCNAPM
jgi:hypothetical protein